MAAPHVAGMLAIFTYWEAMGYDTGSPPLAINRLDQNYLEGITTGFPSAQLNRFAITGIHAPNKGPFVPYAGAPGRPVKGPALNLDLASGVVTWSTLVVTNTAAETLLPGDLTFGT